MNRLKRTCTAPQRNRFRLAGFEHLEARRVLATFLVTNVADSGQGSFRDAIVAANASSDSDTIEFNIESASKTIRPASALPEVAFPLSIDATTQPGYAGKPLVELDGSLLNGSEFGLRITGGDSSVRGLAINSFPGAGIALINQGQSIISGCFIGTDLTGDSARPNGQHGIYISNSHSNQIGGSEIGEGNLISGNTAEGIRVDGRISTSNEIQGNLIGTSADGMSAIPNQRSGVLLFDAASFNIIGTNGDGVDDDRERNTISGNTFNGIEIHNAMRNTVAGNWVGLSTDGSAALANGFEGILMRNSSENTIGSNLDGISDAEERNVVSGNSQSGIRLLSSVGNRIVKNSIGVSPLGNFAIANGFAGILLEEKSDSNVIGNSGTSLDGGNLISGNSDSGIRIGDSHLNTIGGNLIGTNLAGEAAIPNQFVGIYLNELSSGNIIGIDEVGQNYLAERNIIAGNIWDGIRLDSADHNRISGNYIGVTADGGTPLPNLRSGVSINFGANANIIGTDSGLQNAVNNAAEGNLISGNKNHGVWIYQSNDTLIAGNRIGIAGDGISALANEQDGIHIGADSTNTIVGLTGFVENDFASRNILSGNLQQGIRIDQADHTRVSGNWIGTSADGMAAVPNGLSGIALTSGSAETLIGTDGNGIADAAEPNVIAGNGRWGVIFGSDAQANSVTGNWIGLLSDGSTLSENGLGGIRIDAASQNRVGDGTDLGANHIAYPTGVGIAVTNTNAMQNAFSRNVFHGSWVSAVDLGNNGRTLNDPADADVGPNDFQNYPVIESAAMSPTQLQIAGTMDSLANSEFEIELYYSLPGSMGSTFIGVTQLVTDASGVGYWMYSSTTTVPATATIVATARNASGSQSEFSDTVTAGSLMSIGISSPTLLEGSGSVTVTISRPADSPLSQPLTVDLQNGAPHQLMIPQDVFIPVGVASVDFVVEILNNEIAERDQVALLLAKAREINAGGAIALTINDDDLDWHNLDRPLDVTLDGNITPNDVLQAINFLNAYGPTGLSVISPLDPPAKIDTNNDGFASPVDVLLIVNYLNANNGEGEFLSNNLPATEGLDGLVDFLALEWLQERKKSAFAW
ncbi:MAG: right-handed parallel beta-helix repeat-containing protein [Pirellulaceae bacterium]